ncbi:MAG: bifunctional 5,10-methylenetetrahydrofolate dehydrogenase/5,10-methenyltetrahydrofolate cyclohydrolase [bacterium]
MDYSDKLLDGRATAEELLQEIRSKINDNDLAPRLDVVLVGDDAASLSYIRQKTKSASRVGIEARVHQFNCTVEEKEVAEKIDQLNDNPQVDGIIVQLPLPERYDEQRMLETVSPGCDVDGLNPVNFGCLLAGNRPLYYPPTPRGMLRLLKKYDVQIKGQNFVLVGMGRLVGRPLSQMLLNKDATVLCLNEFTEDLPSYTRRGDVVVAAAGVPGLLKAEHFKDDCVVIDAGIHKVDGELVGDVDFDAVVSKVRLITPVPGGVGPLTVAELLNNTCLSARGDSHESI